MTSDAIAAYAEPTVIRPFVWGDHIEFMLVPELEAFAAAIRDRHAAPITAADGRRVLSIIDAIFESARSGRPAQLCGLQPICGFAPPISNFRDWQ